VAESSLQYGGSTLSQRPSLPHLSKYKGVMLDRRTRSRFRELILLYLVLPRRIAGKGSLSGNNTPPQASCGAAAGAKAPQAAANRPGAPPSGVRPNPGRSRHRPRTRVGARLPAGLSRPLPVRGARRTGWPSRCPVRGNG
jgi:hypothetical protein